MATSESPSKSHRKSVEWVLFHIFLFFAALVLIDPFYLVFDGVRVTRDLGPLKYIPVFFAVLAAFVAWAGLAFRATHLQGRQRSLRIAGTWPFILLMTLVLAGSLWARLYNDTRETYLQIGIGLMLFPIGILLLHAVGQGYLVAKRFFLFLLTLMPCVLAWTLTNRMAGGQAFHMEVFLFAPLAVYAYLAISHRVWRFVVIALCLAVGLVGHKNTGYLNVLMALTYIGLLSWPKWSQRRNSVAQGVVLYFGVVLFLSVTSAILYLLSERDKYLPSGSADVRAQTYLSAFNRFLDSPIWGNFFTESSLHELTGITVLNSHLLISHSDLIDLLANGGVLGAGLLLIGALFIVKEVRRALRQQPSSEERALVHGLSAVLMGGVITAAFNSPLLALPIGSLFWLTAGLLYGVASMIVVRAISDADVDLSGRRGTFYDSPASASEGYWR